MREKTTTKYPEHNNFAVIYFYLQGVGSLLGWNAILTALDFFADKFPFTDVYFYFSIPKFSANLLFCPLMVQISRMLSLNTRISGGLISIGAVLVIFPLVAQLMSNYAGYAITLVLLFVLGGLNGISCSSCVGFAANFPHFYMAKLMAGSGIAGLVLNGARAVCLLIFGSKDGLLVSTIVYFLISALLSLACAWVHMKFVKTEFSQYYSSKGDINAVVYDEIDALHENHREEGELKTQLIAQNSYAPNDFSHSYTDNSMIAGNMVMVKTPATFIGVLRETYFYAGLLTLLYVQTFMLFPGISFMRIIGNLDGAWNSVVVVTTFNLFDTIGKTIAEKRSLYNRIVIVVMILIRFVFYASFLNLAKTKNTGFFDSDAFAIINMALFATINGFCTSALYTMGPEVVAPHKKEAAGFIMQLALYSGIISGSFLAIPLKKAI